MTWEETINFARGEEKFKDLIRQCYLTSDLNSNITEYANGTEFREILKLINIYAPDAKSILEFGAGNGISSVNFAMKGYEVTCTEPDLSSTVGLGAIKRVVEELKLMNIKLFDAFAEDVNEANNSYDIIFARQCMHHANNLEQFTSNAFRMLKPGGLFLTVRDHVINSKRNKIEFLNTHPLHKYYGGENAFTLKEYEEAITTAGFKLKKTLRYFDSPINYFPEENISLEKIILENNKMVLNKFPLLNKIPLISKFLLKLFEIKNGKITDDSGIVGRMYSFIAIKE